MTTPITTTLTKPQVKQALPVLRGALKLLQTRGWCQFAPHDEKLDAFCATGAIDEAAKDHHRRSARARQLLKVALNTRSDVDNWMYVEDFNDDPGTTKRMVTNLFRKAIDIGAARLRKRG